MTDAEIKAARQLAVYELWRRGDLFYKLNATQRHIYDAIEASKSTRYFLNCSRRLGKSFSLVARAFEVCLRKPNARVLYLAPFGQDAQKIVQDIALTLLSDAPPEFAPDFRTQDREYLFKNGSTIRFKGVNGERAEFLRGGSADLVILDECGSMDNLDEVVNAVVQPMIGTTRGRIIFATTPASTAAHDSKKLYDECAAQGALSEYNLRWAMQLPEDIKAEQLRVYGESEADIPLILAGLAEPKTTRAQREYWCKWVTESGQAIIPEFDALARQELVVPGTRPEYFDAYVAMDPGHTDNTGILFAHFDARRQKIVVEGEWLQRHAGTETIAAAIKAGEARLWGIKTPYMRVSDVELRLIQDLTTQHGLPFIATVKKDSKGAVWNMRQMVKNRTLEIRPECVNLIRQMETATWNRKATDFADEVTEVDQEKVITHFDLVAALKYLCRMVNFQSNPYPDWHVEHDATDRKNPRSLKGLDLYGHTPMGRRLAAQERGRKPPKGRR